MISNVTRPAPRPFPHCPPWCNVTAGEHWQAATDDAGAYVHVRAWDVLAGRGSVVLSSVQGFTPWDPSEGPTLALEVPAGLDLTRDDVRELQDVLGQVLASWQAPPCACGLCPGSAPRTTARPVATLAPTGGDAA